MGGAGGWRFLLAFAGGCVLAATVPSLPGWTALWLLLVIALASLWLRPTRLPAVLLLGSCWFLFHAQWQVDQHWPAEQANQRVTVTGTVVGLPEQREQGVRFTFLPDRGRFEGVRPGRILVTWHRPHHHVQPGSRWEMELRLRPPDGRDNPSGFDFRRYLLSRRVGAQGTVAGDVRPLPASGGRVNRVRTYLATVVQAETTGLEAAALKRALGLADRSAMPADLADMLRRTGTAHLLAISGLHVGMVAALGGLAAGWLLAPAVLAWRRLDRRRLALAGAVVAATGYAMLAGFTLPTQRALIMLSVAALAFLRRRAIAPGHALLLALVAVLLFDPLSPLATGFWLSFAAVAVLVWAFAWRPSAQGGGSSWLSGLLRAQLVIAVGMLPLNAGVFQQFIPVAVVANLVAIPLVGLWILPALLMEIGGILLGLPTVWISAFGEQGLATLIGFLRWLDGFGMAHTGLGGAGWPAIALATAGALWLLAPPGWPGRWLGAFLMLPLLLPSPDRPGPDTLELWMLDVGDGLAVLMHTPGHTVLYDTGPGDGEGGDLIGRALPPLLAGYRVAGPDRVVVSQGHRGHAGGLGSVRERFRPEHIHASNPEVGTPCLAGQGWQAGGYGFRFLHPGPHLPDLGPNSSCVLYVRGPGGTVLLTGGIDADVEARLLLEHPDLNVDVLVLAAGGHRRGASARFLAQVAPNLALASVRAHDRFERPHPEVMERLARSGADLYGTGQCGALRVRLSPDAGPEVRSMATLKRRFWVKRDACP